MPDLRMTCDARIPTNITPVLGECTECGGPCHEYINLDGSPGGYTLICLPCYANFFDDDKIPYDEWAHVELPYSPESVAHYDLKPLGINQTLECGCILTDFDGGKKYITLCSTHKIFLDAKILMSELNDCCGDCGLFQTLPINKNLDPCDKCVPPLNLSDIGPNGDCNWCDKLGENCPSCAPDGLPAKTMSPCGHCWGVNGAPITPEWTARVESSGCDCDSWGA